MEDKKNTQVIDLLVEILALLKKSENSNIITSKKPRKYSKNALKIAEYFSIIVALIAAFGGLAEIASLCFK